MEVPDYEELEQLDEICPLQEKLDCIHLSEEMQEKLIQYQKEEKLAQVPRYLFKPRCLSTPSEKTNDVEKNKGSLTNEYKKVL